MFKQYYKGFSTKKYEEQGGGFDIYNVECVEEDLLNEIFTNRGEMIRHVDTFGTRILIMPFEINDVHSHDVIREDLTAVFNKDPRVRLIDLNILTAVDRNALVALCKLAYVEFNVTRDLSIEVTSR